LGVGVEWGAELHGRGSRAPLHPDPQPNPTPPLDPPTHPPTQPQPQPQPTHPKKVALKDIIKVALDLSRLQELTGRDKPTVIT
jgi:hypothetical protein